MWCAIFFAMAQANTENVLEKENLWNSILNSVHTHSNKNLAPDQNIVILGDSEVGKTSLVAKLQGCDDSKKGWGLEYSFINVTDTYEEETRLGVWILDGLESYAPLLKYALNERTFDNTIVLIAASMTHPWSILAQLQKWTRILREHIAALNLDPVKIEENRQRIVKKWKSYVEPNDELSVTSPMKRSSTHYFDYDVMSDSANIDLMQLSDGVLIDNFGIEIIVVITKTDNIAVLEKDYYFKDEMLDFIQQWIRRFCLNFGSALFYVSCKEDKNCDILLKYLLNRIYGFPFKSPALVVDKDAVFIPMGWDTMKKIAILYENMHTCDPNADYCSVIVPPTTQNAADELETIAEDEQEFLSRQLKLLQSNKEKLLSDSNDESATNLDLQNVSPSARSAAGLQTKMSPRLPNANTSPIYQSSANTKPVAPDGQKGTNENGEINLINFFNLLLSKKSGTVKQPASGASSPDKINLQKNDSSEA